MSAAELMVVDPESGPTSLAVADLTVSAFRSNGLCIEQVERLMGRRGNWPPILVRRDDLTVIDGAHRVEAARRLGATRIDALFFDGDAEAGFVEFVRRNVSQGLVLTLEERKRAARRVLRSHPVWSDRRIAELCVLSPKTVGAIRRRLEVQEGPRDPKRGVSVREGRDRRVRPVGRGSARARALDVLRERPDASLRAVASQAGVSPETVRSARRDLESQPSPAGVDVRPNQSAGAVAGPPRQADPTPAKSTAEWRTDVALASSECGADLIAWLERTDIFERDVDLVAKVPLGRVYVLAEEARRRAEAWLAVARALEARPVTTA